MGKKTVVEGILLVNKPAGLTSHDVVKRLRQASGWKKIGHFGTLDPLATGLLLLGIGRATRLFPVLSKLPKTYQATVRLGMATDTYDAEGRALSPPSHAFPSKGELFRLVKEFEGEKEQLPPPFSAKKYRGRPLYRLARRGQPVPLKPVKVTIYHLELLDYNPPDLTLELVCSSGTYVRSLAHELGQKAGCGAYLFRLSRLSIGPFSLKKAFSLEEVETRFREKQPEKVLVPLEKVFEESPKAVLKTKVSLPLRKGRPLPAAALQSVIFSRTAMPPPKEENIIRLFSQKGNFLGLARPGEGPGTLIPFLLL